MVKYKTNKDLGRYIVEYKMRTSHGTPMQIGRLNSNTQMTRSTQSHAAHERSHERHRLSNPFYHSEGRIAKDSRTKKASQQQNQMNNYNHEFATTTPTTKTNTSTKQGCCCTIL